MASHFDLHRESITVLAAVPRRSPGIHYSSTFELDPHTLDGAYAYQRVSNPTREACEQALATIEGARFAFAFSSGMAAIAAAFSVLRAGDDVIFPAAMYGGTFRLVNSYFSARGIEARFIDDLSTLSAAHMRSRTRMIVVETPTNPTLHVVDLERISRLAERSGALVVVDNTFMTPWLQRPLDHGAHIVVQSATKYLGGHSDLLAGVVSVNDAALAEQMHLAQKALGAVLDPATSYRLQQSLGTLGLRLERQQASAERIIEYLAQHEAIQRVLYAGSASEQHARIHERQARGIGAVFSFALKPGYDLVRFFDALKIPTFAVSVGAVETLICQPATMSHDGMTQQARDRAGITENLVRLSVGIEDDEDLIADLDRALTLARTSTGQ